jgi:enoyl-CoA hydratase
MGRAYVTVECRDGIGIVRIDDCNDAYFVSERHPMHRQLRDVFGVLATDQAVRAAVIAGGTDQFCPPPSLSNLKALLAAVPSMPAVLQDEARSIVGNILSFPKPLIAAVAAPATGFGAQVALLADFIVTYRDAVFQDAHVRVGLAAGDGGTLAWPLAMGLAKARHHVLRGHPLSGTEANDLGLIEDLVDTPEEVLPASLLLAARLTRLPAGAYAATKAGLNGWLTMSLPAVFDIVNRAEIDSYASEHFQRMLESSDG